VQDAENCGMVRTRGRCIAARSGDCTMVAWETSATTERMEHFARVGFAVHIVSSRFATQYPRAMDRWCIFA
jgi:hypothetical protein